MLLPAHDLLVRVVLLLACSLVVACSRPEATEEKGTAGDTTDLLPPPPPTGAIDATAVPESVSEAPWADGQ